MKKILHVDMDAFFASVEQVMEPELKGKPVIVGRGVVASASYEARPFGVKTGMPLNQALRLCPAAIVRDGSYRVYSQFAQRIKELLMEFSPAVEMASLDEAYVDLAGTERLLGPIDRSAEKIKAAVPAHLGITASVGLASNKLVAKIASGLNKPAGLTIVPPGKEREFIAPLPIARLPGVGHSYERVLKGYGIETIGELASLPLELLVATFGEVTGRVLFERSNGLDEARVVTVVSPKSVSRETTFEQGSVDPDFLYSVLEYLCQRVGHSLRGLRKECRVLTVKLRYTDFETVTSGRLLDRPTNDDKGLFSAAGQILKRVYTRRVALRLLGVTASHLTDESWQEELFAPELRKRKRLNQGIDKIRDKYGFSAISYSSLLFLKRYYNANEDGLILATPCLSR